MYNYKPSPDLLPVIPGDRLYSVTNYMLDDEPYYAEGVVVTEDSLDVILNGEVYGLGDGLFPSKEEALDWIEKNKRPTVLERLISAIKEHFFGSQIYYPRRQAQ